MFDFLHKGKTLNYNCTGYHFTAYIVKTDNIYLFFICLSTSNDMFIQGYTRTENNTLRFILHYTV